MLNKPPILLKYVSYQLIVFLISVVVVTPVLLEEPGPGEGPVMDGAPEVRDKDLVPEATDLDALKKVAVCETGYEEGQELWQGGKGP